MGEPGHIEAAGTVLWRHGASGTEVLLIHRPKRDDWSLAKGKREPGEHILLTAVREVVEETGLRPVLGRRLRTVRYRVNDVPKRVHYWAAARPAPTPPAPGPPFIQNHEVDQVEWLTLARARERLSYPHDSGVLEDFAQWPRETVPLILLRHASAGDKADWPGDDLLRPLDEQGQADARALAALLACFEPRRVVSSPAKRCVDTVAPYAAQIGTTVQVEPAFAVPDHVPAQSSGRAAAAEAARLMGCLTADDIPTVVCTHRENIPHLLTAACEHLGAAPPVDPSLRKSSFWVLQVGDAKLTGLERHDVSGLSGR